MARTGGSKKNDPFAVRAAPPPGGLMKLKPKAKLKSIWKPFDLGDPDNSESSVSPVPIDADGSLDEAEVSPVSQRPGQLESFHAPLSSVDPAAPVGANERDEIMDEFGHRLPDPVWLRVNPGKQDGELRFIQYPNRDVSAHIWSDEKYEWVELGRYSCARKIIEGKVMSTEFLQYVRASKGRPASLAYFTELANEYLRYSAARPAVIMPPLSSMHPATVSQPRPVLNTKPAAHEPSRYDSLSTISGSLNETEFPTLSSLSLRDRPSTTPRQPVTNRASSTPQGLGTPGDDPFAADSPISPRTARPFNSTSESLRKHIAQRDPGKMDFAFRFPSSITGGQRFESPSTSDHDRRAFFAEQERHRAEQIRQSLAPSDRSDRGPERQPQKDDTPLSSMSNMIPRVTSGQAPAMPVVSQFPKANIWSGPNGSTTAGGKNMNDFLGIRQSSAPQPVESRARMLDYLNRIGDEYESTHAPPQEQLGFQHSEPATKNTKNTGQMVLYEKPTSSGSQVSRTALRTSDPEPGYYENRHASIYNTLDVNGPSPQNFKGPFFQDDMPTQANPTAHRSIRKSHIEDLDEWWNSGTLTQRHDAFLKSLITPPGAGLHKDRLNKDDKDFMVTDRILVPLYETLASYVRLPGDVDKAPDYFRRFSPPPEWAIDRSRDGHKSYFGEDWGEAPRRIGRDPRFQPTFGQARFTLFEDKREEQLRSLGGERRSYQGGQSYNSGFPSAPGYQQF